MHSQTDSGTPKKKSVSTPNPHNPETVAVQDAQQKDTVTDAIEHLRISLTNDFSKAIKSLESTLVQATNDSRRDLLEQRLQSVSAELNACKKAKTEMERELGAARKLAREAQQQAKPDSCAKCNALVDANRTAAKKLSESVQTCSELTTRIDTLETEAQKANQDLEVYRQKFNSTKRDYDTAMGKLREANSKSTTLQADLDREKLEVSNLNDVLHNNAAKIAELESDLQSALRNSIEQVHAQATEPKKNPQPSQTSDVMKQTSSDRSDTHLQKQKASAAQPVDLLIVGNSNTAHIKPWKIYGQNKSTKVVTLEKKTIEGAINYVNTSYIKPRVVVLQVVGNTLTRSTVEDSIEQTKELVHKCNLKYPGAEVFVSQPLPRKLNSMKATEAYMNKAKEFTRQLGQALGDQFIIRHSNIPQATSDLFRPDGIHLNPRGVARLVQSYKCAVSASLGVSYDPNRRLHQQSPKSADKQKYHQSPNNASHPPVKDNSMQKIKNLINLLSSLDENLLNA